MLIRIVVIALMFLSAAAYADTPAASTPYSITLTAADLGAIYSALQELPFRVAAPILKSLNEQVHAQDEKTHAKPADKPAP